MRDSGRRRKRLYALTVLSVIVLAGAVFAVWNSRRAFPARSNVATLVKDVRQARDSAGSQIQVFAYWFSKYPNDAYRGRLWSEVEVGITRPGLQIIEQGTSYALVKFEDAGIRFGGLVFEPKMRLLSQHQVDPHRPTEERCYFVEPYLTCRVDPRKLTASTFPDGSFLRAALSRPGFLSLAKGFESATIRLAYRGPGPSGVTLGSLNVMVEFLKRDRAGQTKTTVHYEASSFLEPTQKRFVSWFPTSYTSREDRFAGVSASGEDGKSVTPYPGFELQRKPRSVKEPTRAVVLSPVDAKTLPTTTSAISWQLVVADLRQLQRFTALSDLSITMVPGSKAVKLLPGLKTLRNLEIAVDTEAEVRAVTAMNNLTGLSLIGRTLPIRMFEPVGECRNLKRLTLSGKAPLERGVVDAISKLSLLEDLTLVAYLPRRKPKPAGPSMAGVLEPLASLTRLRRLTIGGSGVLLPSEIGKLGSLEILSVSGCDFAPGLIESLARLPNLRELYISGASGIDDQSIQALAGSKSLDRLYIWDEDITATGMEQLKGKLGAGFEGPYPKLNE